MCWKMLNKYQQQTLFVTRLLVGWMFFLHGAGKMFGFFGGTQIPLFQLVWFAGLIELVAGALLIVGLFTRSASLLSVVLMAVAWGMKHPGWNTLKSGGEPAVLYFVVFLLFAVFGPGKWSLDGKLKKQW